MKIIMCSEKTTEGEKRIPVMLSDERDILSFRQYNRHSDLYLASVSKRITLCGRIIPNHYLWLQCGCMCMCVCVCVCVCVCGCWCECMYVCVYVYMYVCTYVCICMCVCVHMYVGMDVCV